MADLPNELDQELEEAKRFDVLVLNLQLCVLRAEPGFAKWRDRVMEIAGLLEAQSSIPAIRQQLELIQTVRTDSVSRSATSR